MQIIRSEIIFGYHSDLLSDILMDDGSVSFFFGIVIAAFHYRALVQARIIVLADKARYDMEWGKVLQDEGTRSKVDVLTSLVNRIKSRLDPCLSAKQFNRSKISGTLYQFKTSRTNIDSTQSLPSWTLSSNASTISATDNPSHKSTTEERSRVPDWWYLFDCGVSSVLDVQRPVDSLDQLYFQAVTLNPILIKKIQGWALASGGCFCLRSEARVENVAECSQFVSESNFDPTSGPLDSLTVKGKTTMVSSQAEPEGVANIGQNKSDISTHLTVENAVCLSKTARTRKHVSAADLVSEFISSERLCSDDTILQGVSVPSIKSEPPLGREEICGDNLDTAATNGSTHNDGVRTNANLDRVSIMSRGQLPSEYVRWEAIRDKELQCGGLVKWGNIKSVQRSLEKSTRSYGKVALALHDSVIDILE